LSTVLWASSFPAVDYLLQSWDPFLLTVVRLAGAFACVTVLALLTGRLREARRIPWRDVLLLALFGVAVPVLFIVVGQSRSDAVTVAILSTTMPLISAIMGWLAGTERLRPAVLAGIALAILGGSLASLATAGEGGGLRGGEILVLASMILWVWYARAALRRFAGFSDLVSVSLTFGAGTLMVAAFVAPALALGIAAPRYDLAPQPLAVTLWMGVVAIGLSVPLWLACSRLLGVTIASIHSNLAPFYVMLIALAFGGTIHPQQITGAVLVVAGAVLAQLSGSRRAA
jgi:drug/metabolite transporter (DMT)-like permease